MDKKNSLYYKNIEVGEEFLEVLKKSEELFIVTECKDLQVFKYHNCEIGHIIINKKTTPYKAEIMFENPEMKSNLEKLTGIKLEQVEQNG